MLNTGRVIIVFGVTLVLCLWGGVVANLQYDRQHRLDSQMRDTANFARALEEHVVRTFRAADVMLGRLASAYQKKAAKLDIAQFVRDYNTSGDPYNALAVVDERGRLIFESAAAAVAGDFRDRDDFRFHLAHDTAKLFVSEPRREGKGGRISIYLSRRMNQPDGSFGGIVALALPAEYFSTLYDHINLGKDGLVALVGRDGIIRARQTDRQMSADEAASRNAEFAARLAQADRGSYRSSGMGDDIPRILSYRALPAYPLAIVVGVAETTALAELARRRVVYFCAAGMLSLIILGFSLIIASQIRRQQETTKRLQESSDRLAGIYATVAEGIISVNERHHIVLFNPAAERIFGRAAADTVGEPLHCVIPGPFPVAPDTTVTAGGDSGERRRGRFRLIEGLRADGERIPLEATISQSGVAPNRLFTAILHDVSERRCIEQERTLLAAIVQHSSAAMISRTFDGVITSWNAGAERMLGYTAAEAIGRLSTFASPATHTVQRTSIDEQLRQGQVVMIESKRITRDGRAIDVIASHSPMRDQHGNTVGVSMILQDITQLKAAQAAVEKSEQRFRAIFDYAGVGIAMRPAVDRRQPYGAMNDHFCRLLGYSRKELLALAPIDITLAEEQVILDKSNERLLNRELTSYTREQRIVGKNGRMIWVLLAVTALPNDDGSLGSIISIYQDITQRKLAEMELARLAKIVENSNDAILGRTLDGTITSWNAAAERLLGYSKVEAVGRKLDDMVPADRAQEYLDQLALVKRGDSVAAFETVRVTKEGRRVDLSMSISALKDGGGAVVGWSSVIRDISDRKKAEEALQTSREQLRALAARLDAVREQESAALSREIHDELGQVLTGLKMDLSWLNRQLPQGNPVLTSKIASIDHLIDTTLQFVRNIAGRLRPRMLDDLGLVPAIDSLSREFAERARLKCDFVASAETAKLGPQRSTMAFRIVQEALTNIARHAAATRIDISLHEESENIVLEVRDNGRGIAVHEINNTHSLGLLGMRERALLLGSELKVEGYRGRGTVVTLRMPCTPTWGAHLDQDNHC